MKPIEANDILSVIHKMLTFDYPTICRHYIAAELLSLLESKGVPVTNDFARGVVNADDALAISELKKLEEKLKCDLTVNEKTIQ